MCISGWTEVGRLVAWEPSLGVAHVTQISVSPVFLSFSVLARNHISLLLQLLDTLFKELTEDI